MNYIEPLKELLCVLALKCIIAKPQYSPTQLVSTKKMKKKASMKKPTVVFNH